MIVHYDTNHWSPHVSPNTLCYSENFHVVYEIVYGTTVKKRMTPVMEKAVVKVKRDFTTVEVNDIDHILKLYKLHCL